MFKKGYSPFLEPKFIKYSTIILMILAVVIGIIDEMATIASPNFRPIYFREKYTVDVWNWDPWMNVITTIIGLIGAGYTFYLSGKLRKKAAESQGDPKKLRTVLYYTLLFNALGLLDESLYILFDSDMKAIIDGIGEFYIILNIASLIILVEITGYIFLQTEETAGSYSQKFIGNFMLAAYFLGYMLMMLFAVDPNLFYSAIVLAFLIILLISLVAGFIVVEIFRLRKKVPEHRDALTSIAIILIMSIAAAVFLIGCGITSEEIPVNQFPNRLFRLLRILIYFSISYLYYRAFIKPAVGETA